MYFGHYAVAAAMRATKPTLRLAPIVVGVGVLDVLHGVFVLAGLEKVTPDLPALPYLHFDLTDIDWSHSPDGPPRLRSHRLRRVPRPVSDSDLALLAPRDSRGERTPRLLRTQVAARGSAIAEELERAPEHRTRLRAPEPSARRRGPV